MSSWGPRTTRTSRQWPSMPSSDKGHERANETQYVRGENPRCRPANGSQRCMDVSSPRWEKARVLWDGPPTTGVTGGGFVGLRNDLGTWRETGISSLGLSKTSVIDATSEPEREPRDDSGLSCGWSSLSSSAASPLLLRMISADAFLIGAVTRTSRFFGFTAGVGSGKTMPTPQIFCAVLFSTLESLLPCRRCTRAISLNP